MKNLQLLPQGEEPEKAWDRLADVLPSLVSKRSFRDFVLAHFDANDTAPMPILYKLAT